MPLSCRRWWHFLLIYNLSKHAYIYRMNGTSLRICLSSIFLWLLALTDAFGQAKASLDLLIGVGSSFRSFSNERPMPLDEDFFRNRDEHERKFTYSFELTYSRSITNQLMLRSGVQVNRLSYYTLRIKNVRWPAEIQPDGSYVPNPIFNQEINDQTNSRFVGIPVYLRYEPWEGLWCPFIELGSSFTYLESSSYKKYLDIGFDEGSLKAIRSNFNVLGSLSLGCNYVYNSDYQFFTSLNRVQQLNNFRLNTLEERLSSYTISIGFRKSFHEAGGKK